MAQNGNKKLERYLASEPGPKVEEDALLSDVAYNRLLDALRHGGFKPGDNLSTNRISQLLGISRTPVSHAVRRLAQEGIIQVIPGHSISVAAPSFREALDSVDVRMLLEPNQAALVAVVFVAVTAVASSFCSIHGASASLQPFRIVLILRNAREQ